jgi:hypothetical protein
VKKHKYEQDFFAQTCLTLANNCKSNMAFGAVLVKNGWRIIGVGWNRLSNPEERKLLSHVDYAIHAEQAAIFDALQTHTVDYLDGAELYVFGVSKAKETRGKLNIRTGKPWFGCRKCPHSLIRFNISVNVPHYGGWKKLSPHEAMVTGLKFAGKGNWSKFTKDLNFKI